MGLTVSYSPNNAFKRVPPGPWVARCVGVIDLGTQEVEFSGQKKLQHKMMLTWEVFGEDEQGVPLVVDHNGKEVPMQISKRYTLSLNEKAALRRDLAAWRGRDFTPEELKLFDVSKLLGAWCMLNVQHNESANGKTYANVASIMPLPAALKKATPKTDTAPISFDLSAFDGEVFDELPEYVQDMIAQSDEYKMRNKPASKSADADVPFADMDDDVPF